MVKSQILLEVKCYYPSEGLEVFGPLLIFPPTRKLQKTKLALIRKRMMRKPYFGAALLPDFDSGTKLEKAQKKAAQKAFALGMDMGYTAQRKKLIETLLSETTPRISQTSSVTEMINFLSDPGLIEPVPTSPRTIYVGLCRAWRIQKNPEVVKFLNETDYQGDPALTLEKSKASETFFGDFLSNHGILYQTQEELVKEYHETKISVIGEIADRLESSFRLDEPYHPVPKPPLITPDFLLRHPLVVWSDIDHRYHQVKWIEYKNQFGMKGPLYLNTVKQIQKYAKKWGPGAIVYSLGIAEDFSIPECPECVILDFPKIE